MQNARKYEETNGQQKRDIALLVDEFPYIFDGLKNCGKVLDIGCGAGDVLVEMLSSNFHTTVGVDISESAIVYARKKYASESSIKFFEMDISKKLQNSDFQAAKGFLDLQSFDLVTSFFCLHWVGNQR